MARHREAKPQRPDNRRAYYSEEQVMRAYVNFFDSDAGQVVLWDLMQRFFERSSLPTDANPNQTIANEGKRFVVLHIISQREVAERYATRRVVSTATDEPNYTESQRDFDPTQ